LIKEDAKSTRKNMRSESVSAITPLVYSLALLAFDSLGNQF
jgi:hypothetical protein